MTTAAYSEVLRDLEAFLSFCEALRLEQEVAASRFRLYQARLQDLSREIGRLRAGEAAIPIYKTLDADLPKYLVALSESLEVGGMVPLMKTSPAEALKPRLKVVLSGPEMPSDEDQASNQARNIQFELWLAATLSRTGASVALAEPDLRCKIGNITILAACKRLFSEKKLTKRINEATVQLRRSLSAVDLAKFTTIQLFIPEPVEIELEEAWVRDLTEKKRSVVARHKDLSKHTASIVEIGAEPAGPTEAAARAAYREAAIAAKRETNITSIPTTTKPIRDFVELASRRRAPFNEKGHGFRDAVILWTILEHALANGIDSCALVTEDGDFAGPEVQADFEAAGAQIEIYTVDELVDALNAGLEAANREVVAREQAAAKAALERDRVNIEKAVSARVDVTEWDLKPAIGIVAIRRLERIELGEIRSGRTPFPPPEREERVSVSFDAEVKLHSTGERYQVQPPRQMKVGEEPTEPDPGLPLMQIEPVLVAHTAEVETTAIRTGAGEYRDIQVEAARLKRGLGVDPVSWTPHRWGGKERPRCRRAIGRTRRRSGGR